LRAITKLFADQELEFEARLILKREETPGSVLGAGGGETPQLGWMTWMNSSGMDRDPSDTVLRL